MSIWSELQSCGFSLRTFFGSVERLAGVLAGLKAFRGDAIDNRRYDPLLVSVSVCVLVGSVENALPHYDVLVGFGT